MNIAIVTTEPFPVGMAATNRIRTYVKGLSEAGHIVRLYVLRPTEQPGKVFNTEVVGEADGGLFRYASGTTRRPGNPFMRALLATKGLLAAAIRLVFIERPHTILLVSNKTAAMAVFRLVSWLTGAPYVQEKSEFPVSVRQGDNSAGARLYLRWAYKLFDGIICMTKSLEEYFAGVMRRGGKRIIVPMTVDANRFSNVAPHQPGYPYIAYCGYMGDNKDGVQYLIAAFGRIAGEYAGLRLLLIGSCGTANEERELQKCVQQSDAAERIVFTGRVSRDEMPSLLVGARALCLARPDNKQAQGGFPTKLGEYLATGKPVVVTAVGSIPDYLTDGEHAAVVKPDDVDAFAEGLRRVLGDETLAVRLGKAGRRRALECFHYTGQTGRIVKFFEELRRR